VKIHVLQHHESVRRCIPALLVGESLWRKDHKVDPSPDQAVARDTNGELSPNDVLAQMNTQPDTPEHQNPFKCFTQVIHQVPLSLSGLGLLKIGFLWK
jgi:hypothetical protein